MQIQVTRKNAAKIEAALANVNGRAEAHTYTSFEEIEQLAATAETRLDGVLRKKDRLGVVFQSTSGSVMRNAYRYSRQATSVKLARRQKGWSLVAVSASRLWQEAGESCFVITPAHEKAHLALMSQFWRVRDAAPGADAAKGAEQLELELPTPSRECESRAESVL